MVQMTRTAIAAALVSALLGAPAAFAQTEKKELSDKSVTTLMNYAWSVLPAKFTTPERKTIEVDKSKRDAMVPIETGREVIKAGYMSAQAQLCDMWEDQIANYDAMIARERAKSNWTDQQLLYITTLHRMTIHMAAGKMRVVDKPNNESEIFLDPIEASKDTCNDDKRKKVKETILAYVKGSPLNIITGNPPPATSTAGAATPAAAPTTAPATTGAVQPTATTDPKKK